MKEVKNYLNSLSMTLKQNKNKQIGLKPLVFASKLEKTEAKRHILPFSKSFKKVSARYLKSICEVSKKYLDRRYSQKSIFYLPADSR